MKEKRYMRERNRDMKEHAQIPTSLPFLKTPPPVTPGELAAISIGIRLLMKKGSPSDYFAEVMRLVEMADSFLREFRPQLSTVTDVVLSKNTSMGPVQFAESGSLLVRQLGASNLTFENLLTPVHGPGGPGVPTSAKVRKKLDTWFGAISTLKGLQKLIKNSERENVLKTPESKKILRDRKMDVEQYLKLREFQNRKHQARGQHATARRMSKKHL